MVKPYPSIRGTSISFFLKKIRISTPKIKLTTPSQPFSTSPSQIRRLKIRGFTISPWIIKYKNKISGFNFLRLTSSSFFFLNHRSENSFLCRFFSASPANSEPWERERVFGSRAPRDNVGDGLEIISPSSSLLPSRWPNFRCENETIPCSEYASNMWK